MITFNTSSNPYLRSYSITPNTSLTSLLAKTRDITGSCDEETIHTFEPTNNSQCQRNPANEPHVGENISPVTDMKSSSLTVLCLNKLDANINSLSISGINITIKNDNYSYSFKPTQKTIKFIV